MRPLIGILLETYPKASDTFILDEILELERQGLNLHIFSLRQPLEQSLALDITLLKTPITYIPSLLPKFDKATEGELIKAQVTLFQQDSHAYLQTLKRYLKRDKEQKLNEFLQAGYLACKMKILDITHLHAHGADIPTATAEIAQAFSGISYSFTAHSKDRYLNDHAALDRRITKAEFVFACTDYNRRHLDSISTSRTPIHVAYHGIDLAHFTPVAKTEKPSIPLILSIGDWDEYSGFSYLLKACHLLIQQKISFHCVIIGDGPLEEAMRQQMDELGLNKHITLISALEQTELLEYYQQADLFVLPYLATDHNKCADIPRVLLEAMAMEIPVISTNILGITELVHTYINGLLVPAQDAMSLAQSLELLLSQPNLKTTLGKAGRFMVMSKFSRISNVSFMKDLLQKATHQTLRFPTSVSCLRNLPEKHSA